MVRRSFALAATVLLAAATVGAVAADRARPARAYVGYSGIRWPQDFQVMSGHCDRDAISTRTRNRTAFGTQDRDNRGAAMLIGATIDDLIGGPLGRELDAGDRACLGHVLEIGKSGRRVVWENALTGVHFEVTPGAPRDEIGGACRTFKLVAEANTGRSKRQATACEKGAGLWQLTRL